MSATNTASTTVSAGGTTPNSSVYYGYPEAIDGSNSIFVVDYAANALFGIKTGATTPAFTVFQPCFPSTAGGTMCDGTLLSGANNVQVDSSGNLWITSRTNGYVVEVLGLAAPAWPQLSWGHPGVRPN